MRIATFLTGVGLLIIAGLVLKRLADQGQFDSSKWSPLFNPADPEFSVVWSFLGGGLVNTALAAVVSIVASLILGVILALTRVTAMRSYRWFVVGLIETLRGVPVVITIFFASRVLPLYGVDLSLIWYIVIGLTAYNSVVIAEAVRSGIMAVQKGQREAASAVGLRHGQVLAYVVLPQAFRMMLPVIVSQLVVIVKDTSLGFIIGFEEFLRRGQIAVQTLHNPIQTYLVIGAVFIIVNYLLSKAAERVENHTRRKTPARIVKSTGTNRRHVKVSSAK